MNDLEKKWNTIFDDLESIKADISALCPPNELEKQKVAIYCDPNQPLHFLEPLLEILVKSYNVSFSVHAHSSVPELPAKLSNFCAKFGNENVGGVEILVKLIWRRQKIGTTMTVSSVCEIVGDMNIARYFNRIIEMKNPSALRYESYGALYANKIDEILDKLSTGSVKRCDVLKNKSGYFLGEEISLVDIVCRSIA